MSLENNFHKESIGFDFGTSLRTSEFPIEMIKTFQTHGNDEMKLKIQNILHPKMKLISFRELNEEARTKAYSDCIQTQTNEPSIQYNSGNKDFSLQTKSNYEGCYEVKVEKEHGENLTTANEYEYDGKTRLQTNEGDEENNDLVNLAGNSDTKKPLSRAYPEKKDPQIDNNVSYTKITIPSQKENAKTILVNDQSGPLLAENMKKLSFPWLAFFIFVMFWILVILIGVSSSYPDPKSSRIVLGILLAITYLLHSFICLKSTEYRDIKKMRIVKVGNFIEKIQKSPATIQFTKHIKESSKKYQSTNFKLVSSLIEKVTYKKLTDLKNYQKMAEEIKGKTKVKVVKNVLFKDNLSYDLYKKKWSYYQNKLMEKNNRAEAFVSFDINLEDVGEYYFVLSDDALIQNERFSFLISSFLMLGWISILRFRAIDEKILEISKAVTL